MKRKTKLIILTVLLVLGIIHNNTCVSLASFADFSDEDAKQKTDKMINEQKETFDTSKSNNNYLTSLKVNEYELTPEFERQTLEYNINVPNNVKEITIEAVSDDENAKIDGNGKIELKENQTTYRVDVTAESGTVRTYLIKVNAQEKEDENNEEENLIETSKVVEEYNADKNNIENSSNEEKIIPNDKIILAVLIILCVIIIISGFKKYNNKHKGKRKR